MLASPDSNVSAQLENIVTQTQIQNTGIKDEIKFLEKDAARSPDSTFKGTQIANLKRTFKKQLEDYQKEEQDYERRYRDAIARQFRIVNPDATEAEVNEAANANWGDEGVFQTAVWVYPSPGIFTYAVGDFRYSGTMLTLFVNS